MDRLSGLIVVVLTAAAFGAEGNPPPKALGDMSGPWQLFIDDYVIATRQGIVRRYHPFEKYPGNPIIVPDRPWEHETVKVAAVLPSEDGQFYRMWYGAYSPPKYPGGRSLMAVSKDLLRWEKPDLGLHEWKGDGTKHNNFVGGGGPTIIHTPWNKDPDRRYTGFSSGGGYYISGSPDGLTWKRLSDKGLVSGGDVGRFHYDVFTKTHRGYVKVSADVTGLRRRAVGFSQEGPDILTWPPLRLVMAPDDLDDRWAEPGSICRAHFYGCPVFNYQTMYLGILWVFLADDIEGYFNGPLFNEIVSSRDGIRWLREEGDRPRMLDVGPPGSWDAGMVIGVVPLVVGDRIFIYYTGYDGPHDTFPFRSFIGVATLRRDGFVSMDGDATPGEITTKRLRGVRGPLHVNCDATKGSLAVEVLDAAGRVLPGYGRQDCNSLTGDQIDGVVTWKDRKELPQDVDAIRLRFILRNASLYSFMPGEGVQIVDEPAGPELAAVFTFEDEPGGKPQIDKLVADGAQELEFLGSSKIEWHADKASFGQHALLVGSPWRPLNTVRITGTARLGTHFTLAAMAQCDEVRYSRLFSAADGRTPINCSELAFEFDPSGRVVNGLRLVCKGIPVESDPVTFADRKYHHLAVVYDDGPVHFYLDGKPIGERWLPGGEPVVLKRDLRIGEHAHLGSSPAQLVGRVDDVLVLGRALSADEVASLASKGAEAFFAITTQPAQ